MFESNLWIESNVEVEATKEEEAKRWFEVAAVAVDATGLTLFKNLFKTPPTQMCKCRTEKRNVLTAT